MERLLKKQLSIAKKNIIMILAELLDLNGIDPKKPEGQSVKIPGKFKHCKAIGWMVT
ncbi:MAG: hypothetical protein MZV64_66755 [Ignavibacteriales bacterium]|nr:hypothetical protein [Ignavibacteriales bacterium]